MVRAMPMILIFLSMLFFALTCVNNKRTDYLMRQPTRAHPTSVDGGLMATCLEGLRYLTMRVGSGIIKIMPSRRLNKISRCLEAAGRPYGMDVCQLEGVRFLVACGCALTFMIVTGTSMIGAAVGGMTGSLYIEFWITEQKWRRRKTISKDVPFAVDLLAIAVDAGLDFHSALSKVVEKGKPGPLREELHRVQTHPYKQI